ncbi:MAG: hypothetical protein K9K66_04510 [Desulfarculaceae bacterium]|nr:hypothetical protein [Desulfarculaceae bacterium]MCF8073306.1 hypothetical protein [Desulfarculaceae bacterium]MCF8100902.1 hypothetical protein [Desulfarculaceae bacterium]MCF8116642.1 hypothetical protein [Desulfarculaceae bacterium]
MSIKRYDFVAPEDFSIMQGQGGSVLIDLATGQALLCRGAVDMTPAAGGETSAIAGGSPTTIVDTNALLAQAVVAVQNNQASPSLLNEIIGLIPGGSAISPLVEMAVNGVEQVQELVGVISDLRENNDIAKGKRQQIDDLLAKVGA